MSFSYTPGSSATERDYIRFAIGDTTVNAGPLPEGANFSNEELDMMLDVEGQWQRAVAACYEALHSRWSDHVTMQADGLAISISHIPKNWEAKAKYQRRLFGGTRGQVSHARPVIKVDGYSQDVASNVVDDVSY